MAEAGATGGCPRPPAAAWEPVGSLLCTGLPSMPVGHALPFRYGGIHCHALCLRCRHAGRLLGSAVAHSSAARQLLCGCFCAAPLRGRRGEACWCLLAAGVACRRTPDVVWCAICVVSCCYDAPALGTLRRAAVKYEDLRRAVASPCPPRRNSAPPVRLPAHPAPHARLNAHPALACPSVLRCWP